MKKTAFVSITLMFLASCAVNKSQTQLKEQVKEVAQVLTEEDRKKADEDKRGHREMPMTESRFKFLLEEHNTNADQEISWNEYNNWRKNRFTKTDSNNNGTVDSEEYVYEFENRLDEKYEKGRKAHIKQTVERFKSLDKNNDQFIAWDEYESSGDRIFNKWDANQDGTINKADPKSNYGKKKTNGWNRNPISFIRMPSTHSRKGLMKIYDADQDDEVSKDEFINERRSAFYLTDENKDGKINSDEYLAEFEDRLDQTINTNRRAQIKQTYVRFGILDDNKNKAMTFDELQISGKRIFTRWDKNSDNKISVDDIGK